MIEEKLLVVPTDWLATLGLGIGFQPNYRALVDRLDSSVVRVLPRTRAEGDRCYKQLVGYVIFRWKDQIFHYQRTRRVGETRLAGLRSVGIGGHVNATDVGNLPMREVLASAIRREVAEEVALEAPPDVQYVGVINSDEDPVGQVHLGLVGIAYLPSPTLSLRDPTLADGRFERLAALTARLPEFETWSKLCVEFLNGKGRRA